MSRQRTQKKKTLLKRGFSLIELVVSAGILVLITSVVLVSHSTFGGNILIGNLAYDVALSIRQSQVFGLSVREFGIGTGQFDVGYGVHFDKDDLSSYLLFADLDKGKTFDVGDGVQEVFNLRQGYSIDEFCATNAASVELCTKAGNMSTLDIVFIRPNPDAFIRVDGNASTIYGRARIVMRSPQGTSRQVIVESTGQISISQN